MFKRKFEIAFYDFKNRRSETHDVFVDCFENATCEANIKLREINGSGAQFSIVRIWDLAAYEGQL